jgi:pimeloyl-ACP methyl ester carboxylesterase
MSTAKRELVAIDVRPGAAMESQSGLAMLHPRVWGAIERADNRRVAAIVMHPASNFMGHYLITPLRERGVTCMGLNSRYVNNDSQLIMERVIQDLGAGVRWLRQEGYEKIVLIGNSGGAALASFYQAQAQHMTITKTPAGDPIDLTPDDLPPIDGIILAAAHSGRSRLFAEWIDPAVIDEADSLSADPALDMFNPENGPPFKADWLAAYRAAQLARRARLDAWAQARLRQIRAMKNGPRDQAFIIYRTCADPRSLDLSLDPNDRPIGTIWGDARMVNYGANSVGRYTTLTAYLSQWSAMSQADGPDSLARTKVPVLLLEYTGDASVLPSTNGLWAAAAKGRIERHPIKGGNHYLAGQPGLVAEVADRIAAWGLRL